MATDNRHSLYASSRSFTQIIRHHRGTLIRDFGNGTGVGSARGIPSPTRMTMVMLGQYQVELVAQPPQFPQRSRQDPGTVASKRTGTKRNFSALCRRNPHARSVVRQGVRALSRRKSTHRTPLRNRRRRNSGIIRISYRDYDMRRGTRRRRDNGTSMRARGIQTRNGNFVPGRRNGTQRNKRGNNGRPANHLHRKRLYKGMESL